jgi:predicted acetyltransferase
MMCMMPSSAAELVNPIAPEEIPAWARSMATTFLGDPAGPDSARRRGLLESVWDSDRAWGARAQGRWVATLRTETRMLSVPGAGTATADLRADALTNITVAASHRRQGLMRQMLTGSLRAARERGDALSILLAAEWPIYGRFGYAPATLSADYLLRRSRRGSACAGDPSRVRIVDSAEFGRIAPDVFARARRQRAGQLDRAGGWWDRVLGLGGFIPSPSMPPNLCVHEGDGGPDGILGWKSDGAFGLVPPFGRVDVSWLSAATDEAYHNLWAYLTGIDIVDELRLSARPVDERVRWLLPDARTLVMTEQVDFLWLRLLDVPAALSARRYAGPGEMVLEVIDDGPDDFTGGRYRLAADGDDVTCERTDRTADVVLDQRALASIYLGGFRLEGRALDGTAHEQNPGALARMSMMFSTPLAPWDATWF